MEEELKEEEIKEEQPQNEQPTKKQIRALSRKGNKKSNESYKKNYDFSYRIGFIVFIVFLIAISVVEYELCNQFEFVYGYLSTFAGVGGTITLTRGILNKEKPSIVLGIIEIVASIAFFICFVLLLTQV